MNDRLKTPIRMAALSLLLVACAGCGLENPVSPTSSGESSLAPAQVVMPLEEEQPGDAGLETVAPGPTLPTEEGKHLGWSKKGRKNKP